MEVDLYLPLLLRLTDADVRAERPAQLARNDLEGLGRGWPSCAFGLPGRIQPGQVLDLSYGEALLLGLRGKIDD